MDKAEKQKLSESDICDLFITPSIIAAGWDQFKQVRREVTLTPGPVIVRGNLSSRNKKKKKFADYVLSWQPGLPLAVVEAKENNFTVSYGLQQALGYAEILDLPSAFSSNGDGFASHNRMAPEGEPIEAEVGLDAFPAPEALYLRYCRFHGIEADELTLVEQPYHLDSAGKEPRYYQVDAINRTIEAIAKGQQRVLLVMATGTGKTYTTFQIIWRLWKAKRAKRILFLADRNILVDQTLVNDFKPFGEAMTKVRNRKIDPAYEIHLGLYQALTGPDEQDKIFKSVSPDFFDLIVVDECHRGSASEDSMWREILEYFDGAIKLGLTATPKETKYESNITYFGEPAYTYSLKQGIEDGFLAPYKVIRIDIDKDVLGWTPPAGMLDDLGNEIEQREYNQADMDRILVLNQRTRLVANRVMQYLNATDPMAKTIIFCEDIDHAERMRKAIVNAAGKLARDNPKYVMRITGDSVEGKAQLDNFIDPEQPYPVIATTSQLLTTGVDAKTCKLIVLDRTINSMTMFKQIIGRGTRDCIEKQRGRDYFAQELRDVFGRSGTIPSTDYLLAELFDDTLITTNYDRLLEQSFDVGGGKAVEVLTPATILDSPDPAKVTVIKLHGNVRTPASCILSKSQYDVAYGAAAIDLSLPIPQALNYYFRNSSLLFLGCGLNEDRTVGVFHAIKAKAAADNADLPQHFSIEQCPADEDLLISRTEYLLRVGITPIWFPAEEFDFVEGILRLARNEMRYRRR